jgi:hypothetical protein
LRRACWAAVIVFALLYASAIALLLIGTFGWFGNERDPLAGVFLAPLGWPWNRLVDFAPESLWPWLAAAAPVVNLAILALLCRLRFRSPSGIATRP